MSSLTFKYYDTIAPSFLRSAFTKAFLLFKNLIEKEMLDIYAINVVENTLSDLKERVLALRGYL